MKSKGLRILSEVIVLVLVAGITGGIAFYSGYESGRDVPKDIRIENVSNILDESVTADFDVFWQAWKLVRDEHIDGDAVDEQAMVYESIAGMLLALDDPNTNFFPPEDAQKFEEDVRGSFGGIGAEIGMRDGQLVVVAPLKDSPSEGAGLESGDAILAVDGQTTGGLSVLDAVKIIRGPEGSTVTLTIFREGWDRPRDFDVVRQIIRIPTLETEVLDDDIVHIQLFSFNENAPFAFYEGILEASFAGSKGIVLDLRNNPGGFLEVAINLAGWFLDRGSVVVTEEFRSGDTKVFRAQGNEALKDTPTVILINSGSASASEILAGALRDHRGIPLIGEKSFGKGSIQELKPLKDESSLKLTIARWLLPNGGVIEKNGLDPDFEVVLTEEDVAEGRDTQLEKAIEVLQEEILRPRSR